MNKDQNTFQQFLEAAIREEKAEKEAFAEDGRLPLDEQLRVGNFAGPLVCDSSTKEDASFTPHPEIPFDWGKLKHTAKAQPIEPGEVVTLVKKPVQGLLSPEVNPTQLKRTYYDDPDISLKSGKTYLFVDPYYDGIKSVISILSKSKGSDTWPSILPASPLTTTGTTAEARALSACLDDSLRVLAIKGPPGTGKTDLLADVAIALVKASKHVGIVSTSHDAVNNALLRINKKANGVPQLIPLKHGNELNGVPEITNVSIDFKTLPNIWGATLASCSNMVNYKTNPLSFKHGKCDVLLLDEAGQIPAFHAAALSHIAPRMILFGDEDQLPNIGKAAHPPGSHGDSSAMHYIRDLCEENDVSLTIPLEISHRMNETICGLIQRKFYPDIGSLGAGKNKNAHLLDKERPFPALIKDDFPHPAPRLSRSEKEAARVVEWVKRLLTMQVILENEPPRTMTTDDIAILTPFRAHSSAIKKLIQDAGIPDAEKLRIGTVDKMQGQGAAAVIYSLASSSKDYIANQAEWLFSSNRWNVAISRAQACAIVVGDLEKHFSAVPNALHGIKAQQKIRKLMEDDKWKIQSPEIPTTEPPP